MKVIRFGLIISPEIMSLDDGSNINGPCCIKVPNWCKNKLGNYYLYFAHHRGKYIRMAYADIRGHHGKRWNYEPGDYYMGRANVRTKRLSKSD